MKKNCETITQLPKAYTEKEAANLLTARGWEISSSTLARERAQQGEG